MAASIAVRCSRYPARGLVCGIAGAGGHHPLNIARQMRAVIFEATAHTFGDTDARVLAGQNPETAVVDQEISDIDALTLRRKLPDLVLPAAIVFDDRFRQRRQADRI